MMCAINGDMFYSFTKNTWIGDSGTSCHITNYDTDMYDIIDIDKSIQGSSNIMPAVKRGKLHVNVHEVDRTEQVHTLWPMKFCREVVVNLFSLMCQLSQGNTQHSGQFYK